MPIEASEQGNLIGSDKVEGTAVFGADDQKIGSIERVMIDKKSGRVSYAVLSFGGFLGIGESYHPLPWKALTYDPSQGGYVVDLDKSKLESAPSYRAGEEPVYDRAYGRSVYDYYGLPFGPI